MPERLTEKFVKSVDLPASGAITHWDDDPKAKGFGLRVHAGGARSFFINYRIEKRERREAPTIQDLIDRYGTEHVPTKSMGRQGTKVAQQRINDEKKMLAEI